MPGRGRARFSGALLRQRRTRAGLTLEDLAVLLGVSQSAVSAWESGQIDPRSDHLAALAKALDVTTADLFSAGVYDLVALRRLAGYSRQQAADTAEVSLSSLARYERGAALMPERVRARLAVAYEVDDTALETACDQAVKQRAELASARRHSRSHK